MVFIDNENFWTLRKLPESIIFIGGGIISAELGQAVARFGSRVTILDRNPAILKPVDDVAREIIPDIFKKEGIQLIYDAVLKKVSNGVTEKIITYLRNNDEY